MDQKPPASSASDAMLYGLLQHTDEMKAAADAAQQSLAERLEELAELHQWATKAAVDLEKQARARAIALRGEAEVILQALAAERLALSGVQSNLALNAMQAIQDAVRAQGEWIEETLHGAIARLLRDIERGAVQIGQNVRNTTWLFRGTIASMGLAILLLLGGIVMLWRSENRMADQLNRIEQTLATQARPAPVVPCPSTRMGKGK